MGVRYLGPAQTGNDDTVTTGYISSVKSNDLDADGVDARITANYAPYADRSYVDAQDALLANADFINSGDSARVRWDLRETSNGVAGLGATGKVIPARINISNNQRWPRAFWSPTAYNSTDVDTSTEDTVYTCNVTNPGYPYRLVVFGTADAAISSSIEYPVMLIRVGNETTGEVVAQGKGSNDSYLYTTGMTFTDFFNRTTTEATGWGPDWELQYSGGTGYSFVDGNTARWFVGGQADRQVVGRRIGSLESVTQTDNQRMIMRWNSEGQTFTPPFATIPDNSFYLRMTADRSSYVRGYVRQDFIGFAYKSPTSGGEQTLGGATQGTIAGNTVWEVEAVGREYNFYRNGTRVYQMLDTTNLTTIGPSARGWGMGMGAGGSTFTNQIAPSPVDSITIEDAERRFNTVPLSIMPVGLDSQTVRTGPTTLYARLTRSGSLTVARHTTFMPSLYVMAIPA